MRNFKKICATIFAVSTLLPSFIFAENNNEYGSAKNVIMMIPDGYSIEIETATRWTTAEKKLVLDDMVKGLVRVNNSNTPIADSAPAATAMATGSKTETPFISCYSTKDGMPGFYDFDKNKAKMPLATVLEGAKRSGRSTGIVSTSNIQHATPAAFCSHYPNRNEYEILGEQQVYQDMDVVLGAGSQYLDASKRKDKEDLINEIKSLGYDYFTTKSEMDKTTSNKIWGMFAEKSMKYDIDRDPSVEPSLAEMTTKAINTLSKNDKGFFLMVEGSEIDWGAHANDPVATITDAIAFDKAVAVAKEFVKKTPNSVLIVAADHGTGGMTFGSTGINSGYDKTELDKFTNLVANAKMTGQKVAEKLDDNRTNIKDIMKEAYAINDLTAEEENLIKTADKKDLQTAVGKVVSDRSYIGWTTRGHVGGDIALHCLTNGDNLKTLEGTIFNNQIGLYMADVLDIDLNKLTNELYVCAREAFIKKGAKVEYSKASEDNYELKVTKDNNVLIIPMNKNYAKLNGKKVTIGGLAINTSNKVYLPQKAIELIK